MSGEVTPPPDEPSGWIYVLSWPAQLLEAACKLVLQGLWGLHMCYDQGLCGVFAHPHVPAYFLLKLLHVLLLCSACVACRRRQHCRARLCAFGAITCITAAIAQQWILLHLPPVASQHLLPADPVVYLSSTTLITPHSRGKTPVAVTRNFNALWARDPTQRRWISIVRHPQVADDYCQPYFRHWDALGSVGRWDGEPLGDGADASAPSRRLTDRPSLASVMGLPPSPPPHPSEQDQFMDMVNHTQPRLWLDMAVSGEEAHVHELVPAYRPAACPANFAYACSGAGEAKYFVAHGAAYVYTYGNVCAKSEAIFNHRVESALRAELAVGARYDERVEWFARGHYKNVVYRLGADGGPLSDAVPLTFTRHEAPTRSGRDKNFVVFDSSILDHSREERARSASSGAASASAANASQLAYAITLISPHRVYRVDLANGAMHLVATTRTRLPFIDPIGLSAGPIPLGDGRLLVAGHIRRGGWGNATRMTFFYACEAAPPFTILSATPVISFGWSRSLEYCNGIERDGEMLRVSLGVADCGSVLIEVPLESILRQLVPLPARSHRAHRNFPPYALRRKHLKRWRKA